jgi:hypothetical protein
MIRLKVRTNSHDPSGYRTHDTNCEINFINFILCVNKTSYFSTEIFKLLGFPSTIYTSRGIYCSLILSVVLSSQSISTELLATAQSHRYVE